VIGHQLKVSISSLPHPMNSKRTDWRDKYPKPEQIPSYKLENASDDSTLNRMIKLKNFDNTDIVEGEPGKLYYDKANKKVKIFISSADGWKDLDYS
jgi:hypothetical protein